MGSSDLQTHAALVERLKELADRAERHQLKSEYSSHLLEAAQALQATEGALQIYWRQQQALSAPEPQIDEAHVREFIGWLSADIPELHTVEVPRLAESWERFKALLPVLSGGQS
jgi:hypothetical protein